MNCQETLNLLYEIIDKEASQIDITEVQKHLDRCQDCLKKFRLEESLQALVKERLKASLDIPRIDHLRTRVLLQLEQIDGIQFRTNRLSLPFRIPAVALAGAASVVLLIGAAYWGKGLYDHYTEYIPLERAHWAVAGDINSFDDKNNTHLALASIGDFGFSLLNKIAEWSLVGGRSEEIEGISVQHFVYKNGDKLISTFVFPADEKVIPQDLLETRVEINGQCHFDHHCRGCRLVYFREGTALIVTATTDHAFDLLHFDPAAGAI